MPPIQVVEGQFLEQIISGEYYYDFSTIPLDVNSDSRRFFVTGGWFGTIILWHEKPGNPTGNGQGTS